MRSRELSERAASVVVVVVSLIRKLCSVQEYGKGLEFTLIAAQIWLTIIMRDI